MNIPHLTGSTWLADPELSQPYIARVLAAGRCFTRDEVRAARAADAAAADALVADAILSAGEGVTEMTKWTLDAPGGGSYLAEAPRAIRSVKGKVGLIPIWGPIQQRQTSELMKAGGTSTDFVSRGLDKLLADPSIGAIVLHVDSPGGQSFGIQELSDKIYNARGQKPIYAIADSIAASAAYWLATSADMLICTPGGVVGSVGVYVMHVDESKALEKDGVKISLISSGKYKTELSPFSELPQEARAHQQQYVDDLHEKFLGALKRNRGSSLEHVRKHYGQGRVVTAENALAAGMIDRILPMEDLIGRLTGGSGQSSSLSASAKALELRQRQRERQAG